MNSIIKLIRLFFSVLMFMVGLFLLLSDANDYDVLLFIVVKSIGAISIYIAYNIHPFNFDNTIKKEGIILSTACAVIVILLLNVITYFTV